jgi:hypothetical protein
MIIDQVSQLPERVKRELVRGEFARAEFAIWAQTALKEAMDEMGPYRYIEGLGRRVTTIHPELAARIRVKYGRKALHDPDFLKALLRDNPFLRVQCVPAKLTVRVQGLRKPETGNRKVATSRRPENEFQDGKGHRCASRVAASNARMGDPAPAQTCSRRDGGSLLVPPERGSAHETATHPDNFGYRKPETGKEEAR